MKSLPWQKARAFVALFAVGSAVALCAGCRSNKASGKVTLRDLSLVNSSVAIYTGDDRQDLEAGKDYGEFLKGASNKVSPLP